jgi:hypothetical protein
LQREIKRAKFVIYIGAQAVKAAEVADSVMTIRGTPLESPGIVTLHPAFVLRDKGRVMRPVFRHDIAKGIRLSKGNNTWEEPPYFMANTAAALIGYLKYFSASPNSPVAVDTETDGVDAWTCGLRRIGIGNKGSVVIYSPLSTSGQWLISEEERNACTNILADFFAQPLPFRFHNYYGFDSIVLSNHGIAVNETNLFDSLIGHHIGYTAELPHGLDFLASIYTDAPYWKDWAKHEKEDL